jgi:hypothetical protein
VPTSGQLKLPVVVQLVAKQDPTQVLPLQFETTAKVLPPLEKKP